MSQLPGRNDEYTIRSLPRAAGADAAAPEEAETPEPGVGPSLHAASTAPTTIDEHKYAVRFMDTPPCERRQAGCTDCRGKQRANSNVACRRARLRLRPAGPDRARNLQYAQLRGVFSDPGA